MRTFVYFDDETDVADEIAIDLTRGNLRVEPRLPPANLAVGDLAEIDGFLVDYHLNLRAGEAPPPNYKGGTLASSLRERDLATPIVLVTGKPAEQDKGESQLLDELPMFDGVVFKGEIVERPDEIADQLVRLASGFEQLEAADKSWEGLLRALAPPTEADRSILGEIPPTAKGRGWDVVLVARWLERTILRFPGVLLDRLHASVMLGLSESAFERHDVQALIDGVRYQGPLDPAAGRWWKQALIERAVSEIGREPRLPLFQSFPDECERRFGTAIERSVCVDCDGHADAVCSILRKPVLTEHSLAYYPDQRPAVMDTARVSFRAIIETNEVREELIDPGARGIVEAIRRSARERS